MDEKRSTAIPKPESPPAVEAVETEELTEEEQLLSFGLDQPSAILDDVNSLFDEERDDIETIPLNENDPVEQHILVTKSDVKN